MDCQAYNARLFEHVHGSLPEVTPRMLARITWIADHVPGETETILDVGAGRGHLSNLLLWRGYRVTSLELVAESLTNAKGGRVRGSGVALPFRDRSVDVVLCVEVIEHLQPDLLRATLHELWRVARRYVMITVPNNENLRESLICCDRCGHVFHAWGHVERFDAVRLQTLYPIPPVQLHTATRRERRYFVPLLTIRQKVFRTYGYDTYVVCPACGNSEIAEPQRPFPVKVLDRLNYWLGLKRDAGWLLALYDKCPAVQDRPTV